MKQVGIRELKNRLSHYVRRAKAGDEIQVTDRGEPVAELVPPRRARGRVDMQEWLKDLARRGLATLPSTHDRSVYRRRMRRLAPRGTAQKLIDEERGDR